MSFSSLICPKPGEIQIFRTFCSIVFNVGLYFTEIGYFKLRRDTCDVGTYFGYVWKEETPSYIRYQLHVSGGFILKFTGVVTTPLVNCVTKKRLGRTRVSNYILHAYLFYTSLINPRPQEGGFCNP